MSEAEQEKIQELKMIDTTSLEELAGIKAEQVILEERLEAMEASREKISDTVFQRVQNSYQEDLQKLDEQSKPLKHRARAQFAALEKILKAVRADLKEARLREEEVEFRHKLGEFDDETFKKRFAECEGQVQAQEDLEKESADLKKRFVAAFRSEEELRQEPPAAPEPPPLEPEIPTAEEVPGPFSSADVGAGTNSETRSIDLPSPEEGPAEGKEKAEGSVDDTVIGKTKSKSLGSLKTIVAGLRNSPQTLVNTPTRFIVQPSKYTSKEEYVLGMDSLEIGRAEESGIWINSPTVSRRHARVSFTPKGYELEDLGSPNGILLNEQPLESATVLSDGDLIQLGTEILLFRTR